MINDFESLAHRKYLPQLYDLWMYALQDKKNDAYHGKYIDLEKLPYEYSKAYGSLRKYVEKTKNVEDKYTEASSLFGDNNASESSFGLDDIDMYELSFIVDEFLNASRMCQDAIIRYIGIFSQQSLPNSLNDLYKKIKSGKSSICKEIDELVKIYWENGGLTLKHYRDISQHHAVVSSDARFIEHSNGSKGLFFVLLNNPQESSCKKWNFGEPYVHVLDFMINQFMFFSMFAEKICRHICSSLNFPKRESSHVYFKVPLQYHPEGNVSSRFISIDELNSTIANSLN